MFDDFRNSVLDTFTAVSVTESKNEIEITGIRAQQIVSAIDSRWRTGKIAHNMFKKISSRKLVFDSFFAVEVLYIFQQMIADKRSRVPRKQLIDLVAKLQTNTWLKNIAEPSTKQVLNRTQIQKKFKWSPLSHQLEFFDEYDTAVQKYRLNGYLLAAAPGSGKTAMYLFISEMLETDVTIVVCPKNAVDRVFRATLDEMFIDTPEYWVSDSGQAPTPGKRYYVTHYEYLPQLYEFLKKNNYSKKKVNVVLDECHNFNDLKSMRTEIFCEMCKHLQPVSVLWGSGTPIKAMGAEVIPLLRTIVADFTLTVEARFREIFGLSSSRGLDILAHRIGKVSFKLDKAEAVGNQVDKYRIDISIPDGDRFTLKTIRETMSAFVKERSAYYQKNEKMYIDQYLKGLSVFEKTLRTDAQLKDYRSYRKSVDDIRKNYDPKFHKEISAWCNIYEKRNILPALENPLRTEFKNARSVYKYVKLKVLGEALGRVLGKERTACNVSMLQAINDYKVQELFGEQDKYDSSLLEIIATSDSKTLIFTSYVEVVEGLAGILSKNKLQALKVYGETNKDLPSIMRTFGSDPKADPLIATYMSLSTAVPVTAASTVVFLNAPFRAHEYEQALSRLDRIGQQHIVRAYDVYLNTGSEPNISTRSIDIMEWSKAQVEAIMGISGEVPALEDIAEDAWGLEAQIGFTSHERLHNGHEVDKDLTPTFLNW